MCTTELLVNDFPLGLVLYWTLSPLINNDIGVDYYIKPVVFMWIDVAAAFLQEQQITFVLDGMQ